MSKDGDTAASSTIAGVDRIDLQTGERLQIVEGPVNALAFVRSELWILDDQGLRCVGDVGAFEAVAEDATLFTDGDAVAYGVGSKLVRIDQDGDRIEVPLCERRAVGFAGYGLIACTRPGRLTIVDLGGSVRADLVVGDFDVRAVESVFAGRFSACWMSSPCGDELWVVEPRGALARRVELPAVEAWAVASERGVAVTLDTENALRLVCLRTGRVLDTAMSPLETTTAIATDADGETLLLTGMSRGGDIPLIQLHYGEAFEAPSTMDDGAASPTAEPVSDWKDGREADFATAPEAEPIAAMPANVGGLSAPGGRSTLSLPERAALLEAEVSWWKARAAQVISDRWQRGALATRLEDTVPFEAEVLALADAAPEREVPAEAAAAIEAQLASTAELRDTLRASFEGTLTPMAEVAARFDLSPVETEVLGACAVAALDAEVRRLYSIASGGDDWATEALLARLIGPCSVDNLVAAGLLQMTELPTATAPLIPNPALVELLRRPASQTRPPFDIDALMISKEARDALELALDSTPPRIVLRGAPGRGRKALARYVVGLADNTVELIDGGNDLESALVAARIRGHVPCVTLTDDGACSTVLKADGPVIVCVPPACRSPLGAGAPIVDLAPLSDSERRSMWRRLLPDRLAAETNAIAARFRVPPAIAIEVVERLGADTAVITRALRSSLGEALRSVAEPIAELPTWSEVVLDDDLTSSLRELIDRRQHFDRVCFEWGMDSAMRSARGLVALFSGPPGTGKTLAAGLIARELDRPLYRVDLSRVVSKWIGETEKHLAMLFDAAEQADAVVLFDEADSLFAKRTAVQSSTDRNANLEVNYILQRLDTFSGVAILTTNQRSSIDPAFKRRLTAQLHFALPDAETRERLWRAHLPSRGPVAEGLELGELAKRYPFTGGQIRNIAIRAAFLAASADETLTQTHFQRAIELEYAERGRLTASGRLE